jgi:hypothetical protein
MDRRVFGDIDEMLDPTALASIVGSSVTGVERTPIETEGFSDNVIERVTCTDPGGAETQLVLKHFERGDWIAALTSDTRIREISLLENGLYRDLPHECQAPMLAATRSESGDSMLMWDVSSSLFPPGDDLIREDQLVTCIRAVSALHASYWGGGPPPNASVDFCTTQAWLGLLTPDVGRRRIDLGIDNEVTASLEGGWQKFSEAASSLAARTVETIQRDNAALLDALGTAPQTLIHGDLKLANLGIDRVQRLVMFDWTLVGSMSPFIDLGWFLAVNSARLPISKETILELYQAMLLERGIDLGTEWTRHAEIGLLGGGTLRLGWVKALGTLADDEDVRVRETEELEWWCEMTERASRWLD